jgi:Tfp pilus assembly protein PilF
LKKAVEFFNQAIALDPNYALAYAGLADCYALLSEYSARAPRELHLKVKMAAMKAVALDDTLAEAHTSLAAAYEYEWDGANAEREYRRAIALGPNYAMAHHWYAAFLITRARIDEAIAETNRALELDPLSLIINTALGRAYLCARNYDKAIEQLRMTLELDASFAEAHFQLALAYEQKGMYEDAIKEHQRAIDLYDDATMIGWIGRVYAVSGRKVEAEQVLAELNKMSKQKYILPYMPAMIYAALGQPDRAFEWLEKTYQDQSYYITWLKIDPVFDPIRGDKRFQDLMRRVGLAT